MNVLNVINRFIKITILLLVIFYCIDLSPQGYFGFSLTKNAQCNVNDYNDTLYLNNIKKIFYPVLYGKYDSIKILKDSEHFDGKLFFEFDYNNYKRLLNDSISFSIENGYFIPEGRDDSIKNEQYRFIILPDLFWYWATLLFNNYNVRSEEIVYLYYYKLFLKRKFYFLFHPLTFFRQLNNHCINVYKNENDKYFIIFELNLFECSIWKNYDYLFIIPHDNIVINNKSLNNPEFRVVNIIKLDL